jgi:peptidoglycan/LPS O-acetylase OafA/YrhL
LATFTFTFNWQLVVPFAGSAALCTAMSLLWSLSVEEQFYGAWPLLLQGTSRRRVVALAVGLVGIALLARATVVARGWGWEPIWFGSLTRLDGLGVGAALAAWPRGRPLPAWSGPAALLAAPGFLVAMQCVAPMSGASPGLVEIPRWFLVAAILGGLVWVVIHASPGVLASRPFVYLGGRISYGLYVFHGAMYALTHALALRWPGRLLVAFGLTLTAASLSYRYLEQPFLRLKERFTYVRSAPV